MTTPLTQTPSTTITVYTTGFLGAKMAMHLQPHSQFKSYQDSRLFKKFKHG